MSIVSISLERKEAWSESEEDSLIASRDAAKRAAERCTECEADLFG